MSPPRIAFRRSPAVRRRLRALGFAQKHEWLTQNLGRELGFITHDLLEPYPEPVTSAGGFELLCSYNWRSRVPSGKSNYKGRPRAQIFVPGEAPRILPRTVPHTTPKRARGQSFRDVNAAFMPRWPFEPMLRAVGVMRPGFRFDDVDLVINRNSLGHLLRLADEGRCKDAFRLDLAMINHTLIITPLWRRVFDGGNYGRVFEQSFTEHARELRQSQSHHRAILYSLGPLKVAVLCEVDASFSGLEPSEMLQLNWTSGQMTPELLKQVETIKKESHTQTSREQALFASIDKKRFAAAGPSLATHMGHGTLSAHTAEMATMQSYSKANKVSQMWLGRTPYLIMSTHVDNKFTGVQATHCGPWLKQYEKDRQASLQKLVTAIKMLKHFTSESSSRHVIAVCTKHPRTLRMFEPTDPPSSPVSNELLMRFWNSKSDLGSETSVPSRRTSGIQMEKVTGIRGKPLDFLNQRENEDGIRRTALNPRKQPKKVDGVRGKPLKPLIRQTPQMMSEVTVGA